MELCKELGIDDPIAWMNATPPELTDLWLALAIVNDPESKNMQEPGAALRQLFNRYEDGEKR